MTQLTKDTERGKRAPTTPPTMVTDPVCGMEVDPDTAHNYYAYEGKTYYFCSGYCLGMFCSAPARYA